MCVLGISIYTLYVIALMYFETVPVLFVSHFMIHTNSKLNLQLKHQKCKSIYQVFSQISKPNANKLTKSKCTESN